MPKHFLDVSQAGPVLDKVGGKGVPERVRCYRLEVKNLRSFAELDGKQLIIRTDHPEGREMVIPIRVIRKPEGGK